MGNKNKVQVKHAWSLPNIKIPEPNLRTQKLVFSKLKDGCISDFNLLVSTLYPGGGQTDYHTHDGDEVIYIASGRGIARSEDGEVEVGPDSVIYAPAGSKHQVVNTSDETMKMICFFVPSLPEEKLRTYPE